MTRMTREFSLVLLGAGLLTTGYFLWPEQDLEARGDEQAAKRVGGNGQRRSGGGGMLIFIHSSGGGGRSVTRSPAMASVSRGGFGAVGGRVSGGG